MVQKHKASILPEKCGKLEVGSRSTPAPKGNQVLVKVTAAAINPADWKIQTSGLFVTEFPSVLGTDGAGIVEAVGPDVTTYKPGDRVFFQGLYGALDETTFQQYAAIETDIISKIPDNVSDDQAATIPVAALAALVGLFQKTGINFPEKGPTASGKPVLIIGGSSSVGQYGIQLARLAGFYPIITTASSQHAEYLKSLGATHVMNRDADVKAIQSASSTPIALVLDSISLPSTQSVALDVLGTPVPAPGAHLAIVLPLGDSVKEKAADERISINMLYGSSHTFRDLSVPFWRSVGSWVKEGKFNPNRVQVVAGGLASLPEAFELSRKGVSGVKLVVHPQE